jgi:hypothetical protein
MDLHVWADEIEERECCFCGAKFFGDPHKHYRDCPESKKFSSLIDEFKAKVLEFINSHNNPLVASKFYYYIPLEVLAPIRKKIEKEN